ncbi:MAG: hypothetical protein EXR11_10800 [Rhodospirillaceae bacterium]|nr:hypothetical protein [Rhodospirillaceae bacterium]
MKRLIAAVVVGVVAVSWLWLAPTTADAKTLRVGMTSLPPAKGNPYYTTATTSYMFFNVMFDALTQIDETGTVRPWLALEWKPLNETTWHFKLRPNVTFSNGEPFDAAAVKTTFDFLLSDAAVAQSVPRDIAFIAGVSVVDALTVEIITKTPNILLPRYVSGIHIVAPKQLTTLGLDGFAQSPVGTGPFKVDSWGADKILMSAFRGSWRQPIIDNIEMLSLSDAAARVTALETKRVDVAPNINPDEAARLKPLGIRFHHRNPTRVLVVALDVLRDGSPFKDVRVRQALNYAVNRQAIIDSLLGGLEKPASQAATPATVGYVPGLEPYPYDPDKARQLLAEAGYKDGLSFMMEVPGGQLANDKAIAQQIAADLSQVGVQMEVREITFPQLVRNMSQGNWKGLALQTDFSSAPALDVIRALYRHSCSWPGKWYCDPEIQPTLAEAERTFDIGRRTALTQQVVKRYRDMASSLYLFPVVSLDGLSPRVTRWEPWNDNFMYHLADVTDE